MLDTDSSGVISNVSINPSTGTFNDTITVHGKNLSYTLFIMINGIVCRNLGIHGDSIQVLIPPSVGSGIVTVSVVNSNQIAIGQQFTYINLPYVITYAGNGLSGSDNSDGQPTDASIAGPLGIAFDPSGNLFVAEANGDKIRKIGTDGKISTLAGTGVYGDVDGPSGTAQFTYPNGIVADKSGNVYVTDALSNKIRKIDPSGNVSTLAGDGSAGKTDGPGLSASFNRPWGITIDPQGNIFVADNGNNSIRKITPAGDVSTVTLNTIHQYVNGVYTTVSGILSPIGVYADANGNIYFTDQGFVRKIDQNGDVITVAGDRTDLNPNAIFSYTAGIVLDSKGNLFVVDYGSNQIKEIASDGTISLVAGYDWQAAGGSVSEGFRDATGLKACFYRPAMLAVDPGGNLYIADSGNNRIRKVVMQ